MFRELLVYDDIEPHPAALNMAIDEALLESATLPSLRFYHWRTAAVSFGYFGHFADAQTEFPNRELVRRWTGGGIVPHGSDLTYSLILPQSDDAEIASSRDVYFAVHDAIRRALATRLNAVLATQAAPKMSDSCFANAVEHDVIANGRKIAGAAQRRTRRGLLHQGSIQCENLPLCFPQTLANEVCPSWRAESITRELLARAKELAAAKYATAAWLHRR
jgi:lipoate-protein ligase A